MLDPELLAAYNRTRRTVNPSIFCHAPFTSMNFDQSGRVTVCCYNRTYHLGHYPENSVSEIWFGEEAMRLRRLMRRNELPRGCDICLDQFRSRNFGGLHARFYDKLASRDRRPDDGFDAMPKVMEFEISNVCNLECTMCSGFFSSSIRRNRDRLPPIENPYDDGFAEQLAEFIPHLSEARFLGGEPFLIKPYFGIWERMIEVNPDVLVSITTNGTILTDRVRSILERLQANIILSIDSLDPDGYERIRVNAQFDRVMSNLGYFRDYVRRKGTDINFAVCPMRQNWREMPRFLDYCNEAGIYLYFNSVVYPADATLKALPYDELAEVAELLGRVVPTGGPRSGVLRHNNDNYRDLVRQIEGYRDDRAAYRYASSVDTASMSWHLNVAEGNAGRLVLDDAIGAARIDIDPAGSGVAWDVQLYGVPLRLRADRRYVVGFRARADRDRTIECGVARAYPPWDSIGLYTRVGLTTEWRSFELEFVPDGDEDRARVLFDVGGVDGTVEIGAMALRHISVGQVATAAGPGNRG